MLARTAWLPCQPLPSHRARLERWVPAGGSSAPPPPWRLMDGRTKLDASAEWAQSLAARVKAHDLQTRTSLSAAQIASRLQSLQILLPGLGARLVRVQNGVLARLVEDIEHVPQRMCEMKRALPSCDVGAVAVARPALLLEPEWGQVLPAAAALTELLGCEAAASAHVQRASALLAQDIPALVQELIRLFPDKDVHRMLREGQAEALLLCVMDNQGLSCW